MQSIIISRKIGTESTYTGSRNQRRYADYTLYTLQNGEYMLKEDIYNAWEEIPDRHLIFTDSTYTGLYKQIKEDPLSQLLLPNDEIKKLLEVE